jgi:hypothetical protein
VARFIFLRRNAAARSTYTPAGTFDSIDVDMGNVIEGSWRQENDSGTSLHPLRRIARKSAKTVRCNRDEFAYFFQLHKGKSTGKINMPH